MRLSAEGPTQLPLRNKWPVNLLVVDDFHSLPIRWTSVILISSDFAFARSFRSCLERASGITCGIVRVTYYNRCFGVKSQPTSVVDHLDRLWDRPPSVLHKTFCITCIRGTQTAGTDPKLLTGLTVSPTPGTSCQGHQLTWSPQHLHERLQLNTLNVDSATARSPAAIAAFRATKLIWLGPTYFARAMKARLPVEVVNRILNCNTDES